MVTQADAAAAYRGTQTLVTGGLGFVGSALARELAAAGSRVTVVDSLVPECGGRLDNLAGAEGSIAIEVGDVRDAGLLERLVRDRDVVFNLAGLTSHLDSMLDPYADLEANCRGQLSVLEACRRRNPGARVVFGSTRQLYGRPLYLPVDERHPVRPVDVNGIHKAAGEWYHLLYGELYGLRVAILRLTNTYGPRMRVTDARQTFLGLWLRLVLTGRELTVFGDGSQRRDFTYVDDAVRALLLAGARDEAAGEVFNLGGERVVSLLELAATLVRLNGSGSYRLVPFPAEREVIDVGDYFADFSKIRTALGWEPSVPLEEGLGRTLAFYREHGERFGGTEA